MARFVRTFALPYLLPLLSRIPLFRTLAFRTVSQIRISYRAVDINQGQVQNISGGDRIPWISSNGTDNFASLNGKDWCLHSYQPLTDEDRSALKALGLIVFEFVHGPADAAQGLPQGTCFLIRPDGYIGLAMPSFNLKQLIAYSQKHGLTF